VIDRQKSHVLGVVFDEARQRHHLTRGLGLDVDFRQRLWIGLQRGRHFQNHVVTVELCKVLCHLSLAKGIVKRLVDQRRLDAETRGLIAIDGQGQHGTLVCWSVAVSRSCGSLAISASSFGAQ